VASLKEVKRPDGKHFNVAALTLPGHSMISRSHTSYGSGVKQNKKAKTKSKSFQKVKKTKLKSRVPVTALIARPTFHSYLKRQVANQMAAPAELRMPNMHRAKRIAPRECGWKHGDSGYSAREKPCRTK
jgi:hypothetical protein